MSKKNVVVIGYGGMGGWHTRFILENNVVNLLGIYDKRYYPNPIFLEVMSTVGNKVILGMDAHDPQRTYDKQSLEAAMTLVEKYQFELVEKMDITGIL